jgi:hypothetical protein
VTETEKLKALFPAAGFASATFTEVVNGYCQRECCARLPWLLARTEIGDIRIGWRKRVISIEWPPSLGDAHAIFPDEDVTRWESGIHAWGYEKAAEYLRRLRESRAADWRALADELAAALRRQGCGFCDGTCRDCAEEKTAALARYDAARGKTR